MIDSSYHPLTYKIEGMKIISSEDLDQLCAKNIIKALKFGNDYTTAVLTAAASFSEPSLVQRILGSNPSFINAKGIFPLCNAASRNKKQEGAGVITPENEDHISHDITKIFIEMGEDINRADEKDFTPLYLSVVAKNVKTAMLLLKHGATPPIFNKDSHKRLFHIIQQKLESTINTVGKEFLFKPISICRKRGKFDDSAVAIVKGIANLEITTSKMFDQIRMRTQDYKVAFRGEFSNALLVAAELGNLDLMEKILQEDKKMINYVDNFGHSALVIAGKNFNKLFPDVDEDSIAYEASKLLIEYGADVNLANQSIWGLRYTPLYSRIVNGHLKTAALLLNHGARLYPHFDKEEKSEKYKRIYAELRNETVSDVPPIKEYIARWSQS